MSYHINLTKTFQRSCMKRSVLLTSIVVLFFLSLLVSSASMAQDDSGHKGTEIHSLGSITVTAEQLSEYVKNHPQRVSVLDRKEIEERNFLGLAEAVDSMPGVDVRQSGSGIGSRISIRGSAGSSHVLVLVNGRPVGSSQYGGVDLGSIPVEIVKSVTVFKPPVPVWLGPGGTAGAINIVTHDFKETKTRREKNIIRLKMNAGSYGTVNISCGYLVPLQQGSAMVTAGGGHKDGKRVNSDRDTGNFSFHWEKKNDNLSQYDINGRYSYSEHGSPGPTDNATPDARQCYSKGSLDFRLKSFIGETGEFSLKSYCDAVDLEDKSQSGQTSTLEDYKIGLKGESTWRSLDEDSAFRLGGMFERDAVDHTISGDHYREKASLHTQFDINFGDIAISLGGRGDYTNDYGCFPAFSGGLSYAIGTSSLVRGNAGYSVKIPTFSQLYQPSHGSIDQVRGNPNLTEEDVWSYELGFEHRFAKDIIFETTLFRTDNRNLIIYQRGEDLIKRPENISRAYRQGVEASLKLQWTKSLAIDASYIWQEAEEDKTGAELTYAPRHKGKLTVKYAFDVGTKIETSLRAVSHQYGDLENSENEKLDSYGSVDLKIIHPFHVKSCSSEVFIHFHNLFDTDFEAHHGYPDDGFTFVGGLNLTF